MSKFYRTADRTVLLELFGPGESVENLKSLKANTTDAAVEKHVPVVTQEGNKVTVVVSSVDTQCFQNIILWEYISRQRMADSFINSSQEINQKLHLH